MLTRFGCFRCQGWAARAACSPQRLCLRIARKRVDSLTPGAITHSTRMASSLAGLAAFLQRAGMLLPRKPCPDLCRRVCFHLAPAPFRPHCSSSEAALGSVLRRNPNLASVHTSGKLSTRTVQSFGLHRHRMLLWANPFYVPQFPHRAEQG